MQMNIVQLAIEINIRSVKMLDNIIELTNSYINQMPKKERKKYGQFFTSNRQIFVCIRC